MCLRSWRHQAAFMLTLSRAQYDGKVLPAAAVGHVGGTNGLTCGPSVQ
jgi:hypothetical protein